MSGIGSRVYRCYVFTHTLRRQKQNTRNDIDREIDNRERVVRKAVKESVVHRGPGVENVITADNVRRVTEKHGYRHTDDEFGDHIAFQKLEVFGNSRKTDCRKSYRIIEKNLHRLINLRTLNKLQNAVNNARVNTLFRSENIRVKHKGKHTRERYRSAHGEREEFNVRERERKRDTYARVSKALRFACRSLVFAENKPERDYRRDERERENVISDAVLRLIIVADGGDNYEQNRRVNKYRR